MVLVVIMGKVPEKWIRWKNKCHDIRSGKKVRILGYVKIKHILVSIVEENKFLEIIHSLRGKPRSQHYYKKKYFLCVLRLKCLDTKLLITGTFQYCKLKHCVNVFLQIYCNFYCRRLRSKLNKKVLNIMSTLERQKYLQEYTF